MYKYLYYMGWDGKGMALVGKGIHQLEIPIDQKKYARLNNMLLLHLGGLR
jgi:hypothetical protein